MNMPRVPRSLLGPLLALSLAACASAPPAPPSPSPATAEATSPGQPAASESPPAAFDVAPGVGTRATCPVSGRPFVVDADTATAEHEGRHYAFCCPGCEGDFRADPGLHAKK